MNTNVSSQMPSELLNITHQIRRLMELFSKLSVAIEMVREVLMKRIKHDLVHADEVERLVQQAHQDRLRMSALGYRTF